MFLLYYYLAFTLRPHLTSIGRVTTEIVVSLVLKRQGVRPGHENEVFHLHLLFGFAQMPLLEIRIHKT